MIKLSVNVNKIATLRNARGEGLPSVVEFAKLSIAAGAHGITVHPRPDERHITRQDVFDLAEVTNSVEFNVEGFPDERYLHLVQAVKPTQATLVPDPPTALTSNAGWQVVQQQAFLAQVIKELKDATTRVSLFVAADLAQIAAAHELGADRIELYTKPFVDAFNRGQGEQAFATFARAAEFATDLGLGVNAGHDLNCANLSMLKHLPGLLEVSIGHALVCDALQQGWQPTIAAYLAALVI